MYNDEMDFWDSQRLRNRAEELLNSMQQDEHFSEEEIDLKKILHELQVHQIELEMQNDELRQAYTIAETTLEKYTMLYDLSPMGYFTLDEDGAISELNFKGAEMLGERRFSLINSNFKLFISEESRHVFNDFFRKLYTTNAKESCELMLGYDKKPLIFVYMEGVIVEDEQKCLLSVMDISRFKAQSKAQVS